MFSGPGKWMKFVQFVPKSSAVHAEKNHACDVCDKKFKKDQLNTHVSTHSHFVFPKFIREQNICYKMLQVEQGGERLHAILNRIEKKLEKISNPTTRYWLLLILKEYENLRKSDMSIFAKAKRGPYKKRKTVKAKKSDIY